MPVEFSRTTKRKRIKLPGGHFVDVPVITAIAWLDASDRFQETQHSVDNSSESDREVHVDQVYKTGQTSGESISVERIDVWKVIDPQDRYQETQTTLDNVTGKDSVPPHFSTHTETHVVRYKNPDNANVYIDSELIDRFSFIDAADRGQETIFQLNNPKTDDEAQADPNDPDITDINLDPPFRTDPFQNIIGWNSAGGLIEQIFVFRRWGSTCGEANLAVAQSAVSGENGGDWFPVTREWWIAHATAKETLPAELEIGAPGSSITNMRYVAGRDKLSDLITAVVSLSHQSGQNPDPTMDGALGPNPWILWLEVSGNLVSCDPNLIQHYDIGQPSAGNQTHLIDDPFHPGTNIPHWIYYGVAGFALIDDLATGEDGVPPGHPPFIPPTPP
jgi:hypothetical protein